MFVRVCACVGECVCVLVCLCDLGTFEVDLHDKTEREIEKFRKLANPMSNSFHDVCSLLAMFIIRYPLSLMCHSNTSLFV